MQQISIFLDKYKKFGFKNQIIKEVLIEIIKKRFNTELERGDIDVKNGEVRINVSGPIKSEIFIYKDSIKEDLNRLLDKNSQAHEIK